jgi:hypothetical protein
MEKCVLKWSFVMERKREETSDDAGAFFDTMPSTTKDNQTSFERNFPGYIIC